MNLGKEKRKERKQERKECDSMTDALVGDDMVNVGGKERTVLTVTRTALNHQIDALKYQHPTN